MIRAVRSATVALLVGGLIVAGSTGAAAQQPDGEQVFQANCAACHRSDGSGVPGLFPPLKGNENVQDADYVRSVVLNGLEGQIVVLGETYDGQMPAIALSDAELEAVIAYIQVDLQEEAAVTTTTVPTVDLGDLALDEAAVAGERLFGGWEPLENGGPACIACHTAGRFTGLYGPTLGPDLDGVAAVAGGAEALRAALATPHADTMAALYENDPLTPEEQAELAAFLAGTADRPDGGAIPDGLVTMGLAGLVLLVGFAVTFGFRGSRGGEER